MRKKNDAHSSLTCPARTCLIKTYLKKRIVFTIEVPLHLTRNFYFTEMYYRNVFSTLNEWEAKQEIEPAQQKCYRSFETISLQLCTVYRGGKKHTCN